MRRLGLHLSSDTIYSDTESSDHESLNAGDAADNGTQTTIDAYVNDGAIYAHNVYYGTDNAPNNDSSEYSDRPAPRKKAKLSSTKKPKPRSNKKYVPGENSTKAYSLVTFRNKIGVAGMEAFLRRSEFEVDLDTEFPPKSTKGKTYYNSAGEMISRAEAMAHRCHTLHQALIDARNLARAEEASRQAEAERIIGGSRNDLPVEAMAPDSYRTLLARIDLQSIREQASVEINAAYDNNQQPAVGLSALLLGSNSHPLLSISVQRLVYQVTGAQIRGNRLRAQHISETEMEQFQAPLEYQELRNRPRHELQGILDLEANVDPAIAAQKLVVEEFPSQL